MRNSRRLRSTRCDRAVQPRPADGPGRCWRTSLVALGP